MFTNITKDNKKNPIFYECKNCQYITSSNKDYKKHLLTAKHLKRQNVDEILTNIDQKSIKKYKNEKIQLHNKIFEKKFKCICGNTYSYKQSLYVHKKKCKFNSEQEDKIDTKIKNDNLNDPLNDNLNYKEMFLELVKQNNLLQNTISELIPKIGNNNNSNNNNNINIVNNINFLNDKCKDAISIDEFIGSINFEVKNLLTTGNKGLPTGLSSIFLEHYNNLPLIKRPLWCSDKKRKKLFIKEDKWCEDVNQEKTKEAIKTLAFKQTKNIKKYINENPDYMSNDRKSLDYIKILKETTTEIDCEKQNCIINNLLNNIHLSDENKQMIQSNFE